MESFRQKSKNTCQLEAGYNLSNSASNKQQGAPTMPTKSAAQAISILRDGSHFQWHVIPIFVIVIYIYAVEVERKNWNVLFAGLALWGWDWFNEIWNALIYHFSNFAPACAAPGPARRVLVHAPVARAAGR